MGQYFSIGNEQTDQKKKKSAYKSKYFTVDEQPQVNTAQTPSTQQAAQSPSWQKPTQSFLDSPELQPTFLSKVSSGIKGLFQKVADIPKTILTNIATKARDEVVSDVVNKATESIKKSNPSLLPTQRKQDIEAKSNEFVIGAVENQVETQKLLNEAYKKREEITNLYNGVNNEISKNTSEYLKNNPNANLFAPAPEVAEKNKVSSQKKVEYEKQLMDLGTTIRELEVAQDNYRKLADRKYTSKQKTILSQLMEAAQLDNQGGVVNKVKAIGKVSELIFGNPGEVFKERLTEPLLRKNEVIPFSPSTLIRNVELKAATDKYRNGEKLSDKDRALILAQQSEVARNAFSNYTVFEEIAGGAGAMIIPSFKYMAEYAILSPILPAKGTSIAIEKGTSFAAKVAGFAKNFATTALQEVFRTGANVPALASKTTEYMLPNYKIVGGVDGDKYLYEMTNTDPSVAKSFAKAFASNFVENFSESSSTLFGVEKLEEEIAAGYKLARDTVGVVSDNPDKLIAKGFLGKWAKIKGLASKSELWNALKKVTNRQGILSEVFEEEFAEPLQAMIDGREYKAPWTKEGIVRLVTETVGIALQNTGMQTGAVLTEETISSLEKGIEKIKNFRKNNDIPPVDITGVPELSGENEKSSKNGSKSNDTTVGGPQVPSDFGENPEDMQELQNSMQKDWDNNYKDEAETLQNKVSIIKDQIDQTTNPTQLQQLQQEAVQAGDRIEEMVTEFKDKWDVAPQQEITQEVLSEELQVETPMPKGKKYYHATKGVFDNFDESKVGTNTGFDNTKFGFFFLDDKELVKKFGDEWTDRTDSNPVTIKEAELEIKNPLDLTISGIFNKKKQAPLIVKLLGGEEMAPDEALEFLNDEIGLGDINDMYDNIYSSIENKKLMQKAGYDGIVSSYGKDEKGDDILEYVAFSNDQIKQTANNKQDNAVKTQEEKVADTVKEEAKSIKQIAEETGILEPNVRRILGVGTKEGKFERVAKGVYVLTKDGKSVAYIIPGDAREELPRLAKEGFKADMVFLDIPYKTPAVTGGNRGIKYKFITPGEFAQILSSISKIVKSDDSAVIYMFSQAKSGMDKMQEYNDLLDEYGFKVIARGNWQKTFKDGSPVTNARGEVSEPEGILLLSKSGKLSKEYAPIDLNFTLVRPRGYQSEKNADMIAKMVLMTTNEGDVVLDPFAGSGVTVAEAVKAGRIGVGIESSKTAIKEHEIPKVEEAVKQLPKIQKSEAKQKDNKYGGKRFTPTEELQITSSKTGYDETRENGQSLAKVELAQVAHNFLMTVGKKLEEYGFTPHLDKKGKFDAVYTNLGGTGGSADVYGRYIYTQKDGKIYGVETIIGIDVTDYETGTAEVERLMHNQILYRVIPGEENRGANHWISAKGLTAEGFAQKLNDLYYLESVTFPTKDTPVQPSIDNVIINKNEETKEESRDNVSGQQVDQAVVPEGISVGQGQPVVRSGSSQESSGEAGSGPRYSDKQPRGRSVEEYATIEDIISNKAAIDTNTKEVSVTGSLTENERAILLEYQQAGGNEKKGAVGRKLLDEYFTPIKVSKLITELATKYAGDQGRKLDVLEPSAGTGNFVTALKPTVFNVSAQEINEDTAKITKLLYPHAKVVNAPFESNFMNERGYQKYGYGEKYDIVVGNPPYGEHRGEYLGMGELKDIKKYEEYFIARGLDLVRPGGIVAYVVPSGILRSTNSKAKEYIAQRGNLIDAYRLPNGTFGTTSIGTDILIFRKRVDTSYAGSIDDVKNEIQVISNDNYFNSNPDKVLGETLKGAGNFGSDIVKGSVDEAVAKLSEFNEKVDSTGKKIEKVAETPSTVTKKKVTKSGKWVVETKLPKQAEGVEEKVDNSLIPEVVRNAYLNIRQDGSIEPAYIDKLTDEEKAQLFYRSGKFYPRSTYLSANLYQLLDDLESDKAELGTERYEKQYSEIMSVLPTPKTISGITLNPKSPLAHSVRIQMKQGEEVLEMTVFEAFKRHISSLPYDVFGRVSRYDVLGFLDDTPVRGGDKEENALVRRQREEVGMAFFKDFMNIIDEFGEGNTKRIEDFYNRTQNGFWIPDYTDVPLIGKYAKKTERDGSFKQFTLNNAQIRGVRFLLSKGYGLLGFDVGVGKTYADIVAINEAMLRGWTKKPIIVVQRNSYRQWIKSIAAILPQAKINSLGNLGPGYVDAVKLAEQGIEDGSISIVTYEGFKRLSFKPETLLDLRTDLQEATEVDDSKKTQRSRAKKDEKLDELVGKTKKKTVDVSFEDMGFDHFSFDEVQYSNKIIKAVGKNDADGKRVNVREFSDLGGGQSDLGLKTFIASTYVLKKNGDRNVVLLSATPFTNKPLEYYSIFSLVGRKDLKERGLYNASDFFYNFMDIQSAPEFTVGGQIKFDAKQIRGFINAEEFFTLRNSSMYFVDGEEAGVERPTKEVIDNRVAQSELQQKLLESIMAKSTPKTQLETMTKSLMTTVSPYMTDEYDGPKPTYKEFVENSPKIYAAVKVTLQNLKDNPQGNQIIYLPIINSYTGQNIHALVKEYLVKEGKLKETQVESYSGDVPDNKREKVQTDFNGGKIKVLIGTSAILTGLNLQTRSTDIHMVQLPWNYEDRRQLMGRIWRQGNKFKHVRFNQYLLNDSMDIFVSQKLSNKEARAKAFLSDKKLENNYLEAGLIEFDDIKDQLTTDPVRKVDIKFAFEKNTLSKQKPVLEARINTLQRQMGLDKEVEIEKQIETVNTEIESYKRYADSYFEDAQKGSESSKQRYDYWQKEIEEAKDILKEKQAQLKKVIDTREKKGVTTEQIDATKAELQKVKDQEQGLEQRYKTEMEAAKEEKLNKPRYTTDYEVMLRKYKESNIKYYPQGGADNADMGYFNQVRSNQDGIIKRVRLPELLRLVLDKTGNNVSLSTRFKKALGKFYPETQGIKLARSLFKEKTEMLMDAATGKMEEVVVETPQEREERFAQIEAILAHEIGHLVDFSDEGNLKRGNMLGHIFALNHFLKGKFDGIANKEIKQELYDLSKFWRPFDEEVATAEYLAYRKSPKEIYADAVSALLNDPGMVQARSPMFWSAFFKAMDARPEMSQLLTETWDMYNNGDVTGERVKNMKEAYSEGAVKRLQIWRDQQAKEPRAFWDRVVNSVVTKYQPIYKAISKMQADNGIKMGILSQARTTLEALQYIDNDQYMYLTAVKEKFIDPLREVGVSMSDIGVIIQAERTKGDRLNVANPGGIQEEFADDVLNRIFDSLDEYNKEVVKKSLSDFRELNFSYVTAAKDNGVYSKKFYEETATVNKATYNPFGVIKYIERNNVGSGVYQMTGTFSDIENPIITQLLKTLSIISETKINGAKQQIVETLKKIGEPIEKADKVLNSDGSLNYFRGKTGREVLEVFEDGKKEGYLVDPLIKEIFDKHIPTELDALTNAFESFSNVFKHLVTSYKVGWAFWSNPMRDFRRTTRNIFILAAANEEDFNSESGQVGAIAGSMTGVAFRQLKNMVGSLREAWKLTGGELTDVTREMVEQKAIGVPTAIHPFLSRADENSEEQVINEVVFGKVQYHNDKLMDRVMTKAKTIPVVKFGVQLLEVLQRMGSTLDYASKIGGYKSLQQMGYNNAKIGLTTRNFIGTPNYREGGRITRYTNTYIPFSNIAIQALRSDVEILQNPKTRGAYLFAMMYQNLWVFAVLAAASGLLGDGLREWLAKQSEYDKTNYQLIPLGMTPEGDSMALRIPMDETQRLVYAMLWKGGTALMGQSQKPEQILNMTTGLIPNQIPLLDITNAWLDYMSNRNPYDRFRGRNIINTKDWNIGGLPVFVDMLKYTGNAIGLTSFSTYDSSTQTGIAAFVPKIPIVSRAVKVTSYGVEETANIEKSKISREKAKTKKSTEEKVIDLAQTLGAVPERELEKSSLNAIIESELGPRPEDPETGEFKYTEEAASRRTQIIKEYLYEQAVNTKRREIVTIAEDIANVDKLRHITDYKRKMNDGEFQTYLTDLRYYGLLSDDLIDDLVSQQQVGKITGKMLKEKKNYLFNQLK